MRLFVGGLPEGITQAELAQRFAPFGEVSQCELAAPKTYNNDAIVFPRGFGYVTLEPKDEHALQSCLSTYNGCKWRGKVLRCQVAKAGYVERLREEQQPAKPEAPLAEAEDEASSEPLQAGVSLKLRHPLQRTPVVVQVGSGTRVEAFPEQPPLALSTLSWDPLPTPGNDRYQFEHRLRQASVALRKAREEAGLQPAEDEHPASDADEAAGRAAEPGRAAARAAGYGEAARAAASVVASLGIADARKHAAEAQQADKAAGRSDRQKRRVVDFMEEEMVPAGGPRQPRADLDLARFDSDSEGEGAPAADTRAVKAAAPKAAAPASVPAPGEEGDSEEGTAELSSGSSGQGELDEWLAQGEEGGGDEPGSGSDAGASAASGDDPSPSGGSEAEQLSSGGSELDEWLAAGGAQAELALGADADAGSGSMEAAGEGMEEDASSPSPSPSEEEAPPPHAQRVAPAAGRPPKRSRLHEQPQQPERPVADFISEAEARLLQRKSLAPPNVDLSRFDSDSSGGEGPPPGPKRGKTIPQVDGAADSSSSEGSSGSESESDGGSSDDGGPAGKGGPPPAAKPAKEAASSGGGDGASGGSSSDDDADSASASASGSSGEEESEEEGGGEEEQAGGSGRAHGGAQAGRPPEEASPAEDAWMAPLLPEGAAFMRGERPELEEAAWRVNKEAWTRDFRAKHRAALRQTGRASGKRAKRS